MKFYLQFCYNMQTVCCELIEKWGSGTVIMSPRDCKPTEEDGADPPLQKHAKSIRDAGGNVLLDPQFYLPDANHEGLKQQGYWPEEYESGEFWKDGNKAYSSLIEKVGQANITIGADAMIVPGTLADNVDEEWISRQNTLIAESAKQFPSRKRYATVALGSDAMRNSDQIHAALTASRLWDVQGIYLICEHPEGKYMVDQDIWMLNVLDLVAGFRLRDLDVIVGYANQQMLACACFKATAIASGSDRMKRRFSRNDLMQPEKGSTMQQATWYYCPQAYSEYKLARLSSAQLQGILHSMRHPPELGVTYADVLFSGADPAAVGFKRRLSALHYLGCLHSQSAKLTEGSFDDTVESYLKSVDAAEALTSNLEEKRIRAEERSFLPVVDPVHVAINLLKRDRGAIMRRRWNQLN